MAGYERLKSVGGGGRYDALASDGRTTYPGVGVSFGVSRTLVPLIADGVLAGSRPVPSAVLVALVDEESRPASDAGRGGAARARHRLRGGRRARRSSASRSGTPSAAASRSSGSRATRGHEVKDIRSGDQVAADPDSLDTARRGPATAGPSPPTRRSRHVIRTHDAGALRAEHVGQTVTLAGWVARRRDHGGVAFLDLREASGVVQVVVRDEAVAHSLRNEYCLKVTGEVALRPEGNENPNLPTGEIEVDRRRRRGAQRRRRRCRSRSTTTCDVGEEARLKHRYLDLRRAGPTAALRLRSKVNKAARDVLDGHDFVEIETPTLTRSTPEGARDFLVPARLQPGSWYALPQSPQLFKQLLMVAGMERYYQIARCYRDEDFRADRQPEFTQLDIEMSFVDQDDVIAVAEEVLVALWALIGHEVPTPIPRMTYAEAMARFGTDKPDLRMGLELVDCTEYFARHPVPGLPGAVRRRRRHARRGRASRAAVRRLAGVGQAARRPRAGLRPRRRGRRARRSGRQEPLRGGAGRPGRPRRRRSRATASSSPPGRSSRAGRCSVRRAWRSAAAAG